MTRTIEALEAQEQTHLEFTANRKAVPSCKFYYHWHPTKTILMKSTSLLVCLADTPSGTKA